MKKVLERESATEIAAGRLRRVLAGGVLVERIGDERLGRQVVIRFSPGIGGRRDRVAVTVKWYEWHDENLT